MHIINSNSSENSYTDEVADLLSDVNIFFYRLEHLLIEQNIGGETEIRDIFYSEAER